MLREHRGWLQLHLPVIESQYSKVRAVDIQSGYRRLEASHTGVETLGLDQPCHTCVKDLLQPGKESRVEVLLRELSPPNGTRRF